MLHYEELDVLQEALDYINGDGTTALLLAIWNRHNECVDVLVKAGATIYFPTKVPPVLEAVRMGNAKGVDILLQFGPDLNLECMRLKDMIKTARDTCVNVLIHTGANVNNVLSVGDAAIICAVANCYLPCLISLLHAGVEVNIDFRCQSSSLIVAAAAGLRGLACVKCLLKMGAFVNITNMVGNNALQICIARGNDTPKNKQKCLLLFTVGEKLNLMAKSFTFMGQNVSIPDYLKEQDQGLCLKHLCRETIRHHLIFLDPHLHLFGRISELKQPSLITSYLLYDMSLE